MILTTTPAIEGHTIREYKGVVFGEVITGVNFLKERPGKSKLPTRLGRSASSLGI